MNALAVPEKADILFAEDFREELANKITLNGFFAGDSILVSGEQAGKALASLVLVAVFSGESFNDVSGGFKFDVSIKSPSKKDVITFNGTAQKEAKKTMSVVLKWIGFPVPEFGPYVVTINIAGKTFTKTLRIVNAL